MARAPPAGYSGDWMIQSRLLRRLGLLVALAAAYVVAGKFGLRLAFANPSASPVWAPTGIALAAFLLLGYGVWPAILVSAFLVNLTTAGSVATSIGIAVGNTLEGLTGAYLINRFARGPRAFERAPNVFKAALLAGVVSTTVSATIGTTTISLGGFARWADYGSIWLTWWLEDAILLLCVIVVGLAVFGGLFPSRVKDYPLEFLCVPFLVWASFRFGPREAATAAVVLSGVAIWGTLRGLGPFARGTPNESLLLLQAFMGVMVVMTLVLAAVVAERREGEERLRRLAVSDPLTGLANYRQLVAALDAEIPRSDRTDRPFAVVMLDLDGLKRINDRHGHLVGSMALRRVAERS